MPGADRPMALLSCLLLLMACAMDSPAAPPSRSTAADPGVDTVYQGARVWCTLADSRVTELSGLAPSRRNPAVLWAHNDSGDRPRVFAVDTLGQVLAVCTLQGARNVDWEDMASVELQGQAWLYVGDTGDNDGERPAITVYRFPEPLVADDWRDSSITAAPEPASFRYPDGARDCEAMMVDPRDGMLLFVEKTSLVTGVYAAPWPGRGGEALLQRLGAVTLPLGLARSRLVTGADMHPDGTGIVLRTYGSLFEFRGGVEATPAAILAASPTSTLATPGLPQAEAVCYTWDGAALCTSSEGRRQPLVVLRRTR